jgi:small subunit ribosomal protein S3
MLNGFFVKQGIRGVEIEKFIKVNFPMGDYSKMELQRTPLGIKIVIYTNKPGRIIGRGGKNINEMTDALKEKFSLENPQIDIKSIRNPNLDARIVAKQIASALEKGYNYKKIGNLTLKRIMDSGAVGAEIIISGKLGGGKGVMSKMLEGYLKHSGQPSKDFVDYGFEEATMKPGKIGIKVKIMKDYIDLTGRVVAKKELKKRETIEAPEITKQEIIEELKEEEQKKEKVIEKASAKKAKPKKTIKKDKKKVKTKE